MRLCHFLLSKTRQIQKDKCFLLYVESILEHDMNIYKWGLEREEEV